MSKDYEDQMSDGFTRIMSPLFFVFPPIIMLLAFFTARLTGSRALTYLVNLPATWMMTNCMLGILLMPVALLVGIRNPGMDVFSWVGEITFMKQIWFPLIFDFWHGIGIVVFGSKRELLHMYFEEPIVVASTQAIVGWQLFMWYFVGRHVNRALTWVTYR